MSSIARLGAVAAAALLLASCQSPTTTNPGTSSGITASSVKVIGTIPTVDAAASVVDGHYLYTGRFNAAADNLQIWDITDLKNPVKHGTLSGGSIYGIVILDHTLVVQTDGAGSGSFANGGVVPVDVSDIDNPVAGSSDNQGYSSDYGDYLYNNVVWNFSGTLIGVYGIASGLSWSNNITTEDAEWGTFYNNRLAFLDKAKLRIVNIADTTAPTDVYTSDDLTNASAGGTAFYQNRLYLGLSDGTLQVVDVAQETTPTFGTPVTIDAATDPILDVKLVGSHLLCTSSKAFFVVSLANPDHPVLVTKVGNSAGKFDSNNAWQITLYQDRYAIVANNTNYRIIQLY